MNLVDLVNGQLSGDMIGKFAEMLGTSPDLGKGTGLTFARRAPSGARLRAPGVAEQGNLLPGLHSGGGYISRLKREG